MQKQREFHPRANAEAKKRLEGLLSSPNSNAYRENMLTLGSLLGTSLIENIDKSSQEDILVISTAEDADFLQAGVSQALHDNGISTKLAVFWNNHYSIRGDSVAPIVHKYLQPGYEFATNIIIVKSVISGSCVVRTNLLELLDKVKVARNVYVVSPVMYVKAEESLRKEFPKEISEKFQFIYFAKDAERTRDGEVVPGIGGQIYELLGLSKQPVLKGYLPKTVRNLAFASL